MEGEHKDEICWNCAKNKDLVPRRMIVSAWLGKCDFCGRIRPLSSLRKEWKKKEVENVKDRQD